jgi:CDP-diacylglycerol--glycerol-3-phosphate 3-phosphatidyltransferase
MIKLLPNILTLLRILSIPFLVITLFKGYPVLTLLIFIFASLTDYYDGYIARKYKIISNFGKLMDPLADKCLILTALILINIKPIAYIHWIITLIIMAREIAVTILRHHYQMNGIIMPANMGGKVKTTFQMIGIIACFTFYTIFDYAAPPTIVGGGWGGLIDFVGIVVEYIMAFMAFIAIAKDVIILVIQVFFWLVVVVTVWTGIIYFRQKPEEKDG